MPSVLPAWQHMGRHSTRTHMQAMSKYLAVLSHLRTNCAAFWHAGTRNRHAIRRYCTQLPPPAAFPPPCSPQVELSYPYPPDVHIAGEEDDGAAAGAGEHQSQGQRHGGQAHNAAHGVVGPGKGFGANAAATGGSGGAGGAGSGGSGAVPVIRVVRSCTEGTLAAHAAAGVADLVAAERASGGDIPSLLSFELGMLALLGLALPVVYWRKIRIRHL